MSILPHSTEGERRLLVLSELTLSQLGIDTAFLGPSSSKPVFAKCIVCHKPYKTTFGGVIRKQKALTCSLECRSTLRSIKAAERMASEPEEVRNRRRKAHQSLYSDPTRVQKIIAAREAKALASTGYRHHMHSFEQRERASAHFRKKEIREKRRASIRKKMGVDYPFQSSEVQEKVKKTNMERYGTSNPGSLPNSRIKAAQTCIERYGVENIFRSEDFSDHLRQVWLEKYGVEHPNQLPERRERLKEWCIQNPEKHFTSKGESELLLWIQTFYPSAQKYKDREHEIDIFIPDISLGIEYNGLYWHQESIVGKNYHLDKTRYFKEKGIRIIHIFEHEWKNRQKQVKSFLLSAIGQNKYRIGARECQLIWSSDKEDVREAHQFLEGYHIQGQSRGTKYVIKVLHDNALVAVATFGRHHRTGKEWVLTRFCTKTNYTIQGLLSRISRLASKKLKEDILSWADYRLSDGNGYGKAGWKFEKLLPPDYFYHKHGAKVVSKQMRQKSIAKTPENMTEKEHAVQDGLTRVWDCGKIRYCYPWNV